MRRSVAWGASRPIDHRYGIGDMGPACGKGRVRFEGYPRSIFMETFGRGHGPSASERGALERGAYRGVPYLLIRIFTIQRRASAKV
jgi:hypothetical protein